MLGSKGYYSLIQYCPDPSRLEVANVGVLLFCPELHFINARMAPGNNRVRKIFSVSGKDLLKVDSAKRAIAERIEIAADDFRSLEDLQAFVKSRGNDIILTEPRAIKVSQPKSELNELYAELVEGRSRAPSKVRGSEIPELGEIFRKRNLQDRIDFDLTVSIPVTGQDMHIPYAFRNGLMNLIRPQRFPENETVAFTKASVLSVDGSLLRKQQLKGLGCQLIVVSRFEDPSSPLAARIGALFGEYQIPHYEIGRIDGLVEMIEKQAHR